MLTPGRHAVRTSRTAVSDPALLNCGDAALHTSPELWRRPRGADSRSEPARVDAPPVRSRCRLRRDRELGGRAWAEPLPGARRGDLRARRRSARRARHADRQRQEPCRGRRACDRARPRAAHLLHGADQGPREREVLPARRHLRRRERRHGDGRLGGQRRCSDHLLHGRDSRQPGATRRRRPREPASSSWTSFTTTPTSTEGGRGKCRC